MSVHVQSDADLPGGEHERVESLPASAVPMREGVISALPGGLHALLCDWDAGLPAQVLDVHAAEGLPALHVFESSPGKYHGIAFTARTASEIVRLQAALGSDPTHSDAGRRIGWWVLRTEGVRHVCDVPGAPDECAPELQVVHFGSTWHGAKERNHGHTTGRARGGDPADHPGGGEAHGAGALGGHAADLHGARAGDGRAGCGRSPRGAVGEAESA